MRTEYIHYTLYVVVRFVNFIPTVNTYTRVTNLLDKVYLPLKVKKHHKEALKCCSFDPPIIFNIAYWLSGFQVDLEVFKCNKTE